MNVVSSSLVGKEQNLERQCNHMEGKGLQNVRVHVLWHLHEYEHLQGLRLVHALEAVLDCIWW